MSAARLAVAPYLRHIGNGRDKPHVSQKRFVQLSEYVVPEPIPQRPAGYFAVEESPAESARANYLAALSPDRPE